MRGYLLQPGTDNLGARGRKGRRGRQWGLSREGGLEQGFSVRGGRQAKIDWHQRARARVIVISPLILWVFHQEIQRSSRSSRVHHGSPNSIRRLAALPCSIRAASLARVFFLWRCCFQGFASPSRLACATAQMASQATAEMQLFSIPELKYFSFRNVPAWLVSTRSC